MKTTIEISENIMLRSKRLAMKKHVALRSLVEEGLLMVVERMEEQETVDVKPVTFSGQGLSPEFANAGWPQIRQAIYEPLQS